MRKQILTIFQRVRAIMGNSGWFAIELAIVFSVWLYIANLDIWEIHHYISGIGIYIVRRPTFRLELYFLLLGWWFIRKPESHLENISIACGVKNLSIRMAGIALLVATLLRFYKLYYS